MAEFQIEKVTNLWLKITEQCNVQVIRVSVINGAGQHTTDEFKHLMDEVYYRSAGFTTMAAAWGEGVDNATYVQIAEPGHYSIGGDTGLKVGWYTTRNSQRNWATHDINTEPGQSSVLGGLILNNVHIAGASVFTGYAPYEVSMMVLITDEDYHALYSPNSIYFTPQINILDTSDIGWTNSHRFGIGHVKVQPGYTQTYRGLSSTSLQLGGDLRPYIIGEREDPDDPYYEVPTSEPEQPDEPEYDPNSDTTPPSPLPTVDMTDTGFTRIYNPTLAQLRDIASYLWTDQTFFQTLWNHLKQCLENPMDAFIALNLVPCAIPDGGNVEFKIMYLPTGKYVNLAAKQFIPVNCGSLRIPRTYATALDYSPYTKASIFLPFIGSQPLDIDDIMGKTLSVEYNIDIVSGSCVATVLVNGNVHYQYSGHCAVTLPFTAADFIGYVSAAISTAKNVAGVALGAAGSPIGAEMLGMPAPEHTTSGTTITYGERRNAEGEMATVYSSIHTARVPDVSKASFGSLARKAISNTVSSVMGAKTVVEHTGNFSGISGYIGCRYPYVTLTIPRVANPEKYGKYNGRPVLSYESLGSLSGYTEVQEIQLTGISATNPELDEIAQFLKGGVIL